MEVAGDSDEDHSLGFDVVGDDPDALAPDAQPRGGGRRVLPQVGPLCLCLVIASTNGFWASPRHDIGEGRPAQSPEAAALAEGSHLVGAVVCNWEFMSASDSSAGLPTLAWLKSQACRTVTAEVEVFGYIAYKGLIAVALDEPVATEAHHPNSILQMASDRRLREGGRLGDWVGQQGRLGIISVMIGPALALAVVSAARSYFHIVAITKKTQKKRLLRSKPSRRQMGRFLSSAPAPPGLAITTKQVCEPRVFGMEAKKITECVCASMHLKDVKNISAATKAFSRALSGSREEAVRLVAKSKPLCRESLRAARVRVDVLAMLLFRKLWQDIDHNTVWIHIWVDGSPQWRGTEMYAASFDLYVHGTFIKRRLLPCVSLRSGQLDAVSKTAGLMWSIWLLVGPSASSLRAFCSRVVSICSDDGVERQLVEMGDFIDSFIAYIGGGS